MKWGKGYENMKWKREGKAYRELGGDQSLSRSLHVELPGRQGNK